MNQHQDLPSGRKESFKATTKEEKKTTQEEVTTQASTKDKPITTPDELFAACRVAVAMKKPHVFVHKKCMSIYLGESTAPGFTMMGIHVIEDGREEEYYADFKKTTENVVFPKTKA